MRFKENLELLSKADKFEIHECENGYIIEDKIDKSIMVDVQNGFFDVNYYVTGCYNSGKDFKLIDMELLERLREFVGLLKGKGE